MWTPFEDRILAMGLVSLREMARFPRMVNRGYERVAAQRSGSVVEIPIAGAIAAYDIQAQANPYDGKVPDVEMARIQLNKHKGAGFVMTDFDRAHIVANDGVETQLTAAVRSLANAVNQDVADAALGFYATRGTPGAAPFDAANDISDAINCKIALDAGPAPEGNRYGMLNSTAEGKFLGQTAVQRADAHGTSETIMRGTLGNVMGIDWYGNNHYTPSHDTAITVNKTVDLAANYAIGAKQMHIDGGTAAQRPKAGDIFVVGDGTTFSEKNNYVVTAGYAAGSEGDISFYPGLRTAVLDDAVLKFLPDHDISPVFHMDAIGLVSRPLGSAFSENMRSVPDSVTGLVLRLEIVRQRKRDFYELDVHWGAREVRPELGMRLVS